MLDDNLVSKLLSSFVRKSLTSRIIVKLLHWDAWPSMPRPHVTPPSTFPNGRHFGITPSDARISTFQHGIMDLACDYISVCYDFCNIAPSSNQRYDTCSYTQGWIIYAGKINVKMFNLGTHFVNPFGIHLDDILVRVTGAPQTCLFPPI